MKKNMRVRCEKYLCRRPKIIKWTRMESPKMSFGKDNEYDKNSKNPSTAQTA